MTTTKLKGIEECMRNNVSTAATVAGFLFIAYWVIFGWMVYVSPLTYREMDFDHDGQVSFGEAGYASSFGTRMYVNHGRHCTEYLAYKDGLPLKTSCRD
ncbi:hypothetical protein AB2N08_20255 [Massilia aurea]|uniref:hypothetical protein n=1 Tax=Massilia aurea TaxID=373040 RepID=UPI003461ACBF